MVCVSGDRRQVISWRQKGFANLLIGLFGVATTYASQALTRAREFGMLRHLGADRRTVITHLALEATVGEAEETLEKTGVLRFLNVVFGTGVPNP